MDRHPKEDEDKVFVFQMLEVQWSNEIDFVTGSHNNKNTHTPTYNGLLKRMSQDNKIKSK